MRKYIFIAIIAVAAFIALSQGQQPPTSASAAPLLRIDYLDVGQGDAILITTPSQYQVLIDGGPNQAVLSQLQQAMPLGDTSIDLVILTHPDADHLAGLIDVARDYNIGLVLMPDVEKDTKMYAEWLRVLAQKSVESRRIMDRENFTLPDEAKLLLIHPSPQTYKAGEPANDASIVLRLDYGKRRFLFTGDIEAEIETRLVQQFATEIDADILKVPHHGSKTSSTDLFLHAVSPTLAVIQVGRDNRYHHPAPSVLSRYEAAYIDVARTDQRGAISLQTDGFTVWLAGDCGVWGNWFFPCQAEKVYTFSDNL